MSYFNVFDFNPPRHEPTSPSNNQGMFNKVLYSLHPVLYRLFFVMPHNIVNFIKDLIVHVNSLWHGCSPRYKNVVNVIGNCAFAPPIRPEW